MNEPLTFGLTHLALSVRNLEVSLAFYQLVFDMEVMYKQDGFVQLTTPGNKDILVLEEKEIGSYAGTGGIEHFGFRLKDPGKIDEVIKKVEATGTSIQESGEFVPGEPYVFFRDPDGYMIEVWFEKLNNDQI